MYMSPEERKTLQSILENAVDDVETALELDFYRLMLSMIYELNDKDERNCLAYSDKDCQDERCVCFWNVIQEVFDGFSSLELPQRIDEQYLKSFSLLADNLTLLSTKIHELRTVLARAHAEGQPLTEHEVLAMQ